MTEKTHRENRDPRRARLRDGVVEAGRAIAENRKARKPSASESRATVRNGVPLLRRRPAATPKPTLARVNRRRDEP